MSSNGIQGESSVAGADEVRRISSNELFFGQRCIIISHDGAEYRLQITRQNKLILTK